MARSGRTCSRPRSLDDFPTTVVAPAGGTVDGIRLALHVGEHSELPALVPFAIDRLGRNDVVLGAGLRVTPLHLAVLLECVRGALAIFVVHVFADTETERTASNGADQKTGGTTDRIPEGSAGTRSYRGARTSFGRAARK